METALPPRPASPALVSELVAICGARHVLSDARTLAAYRCDALSPRGQLPGVAVLPASAGEVAAVVKACAAAETPWVVRGAGTNLSGGALPHPGAVLIVLSRMRRVISAELADGVIVVEPGVTHLAVARTLAPTHFFPPAPSSDGVATIGGAVAENAGGPRSLKYGMTSDYVVGLDIVLADGTLVQLRDGAPGYDLLGAFAGSEGTLGIAVAIHLRVVPVPETVRTVVGFFETTAAAAGAVASVREAGLAPAAMELIDALAIRATNEVTAGIYRPDAGAALLVELDGPHEDCATSLEVLLALCSRAGARDIRIAVAPRERELLWGAPTVAFAAMRHVASAYDVHDVSVPPSRLAEVIDRTGVLAVEFGLAVAHVIHAGDGNLHPIICYDSRSPADAARARELGDRIIGVCVDAGGSIAGEHGIGADKPRLMPAMFEPSDLNALRALRGALDPHALANPGKLLPSPPRG